MTCNTNKTTSVGYLVDTPKNSKSSEITSGLDQVEKLLEVQMELLDNLYSRLLPILHDYPGCEQEMCCDRDPIQSQLGQQICSIRERLEVRNERIREINDKIRL